MTRDLIYWHQSLFLQPQHLQIMDRSSGFLFREGVRLWADYPYGLLKIVVSTEALATNNFQIDELDMLAPGSSEIIQMPYQAVCPARALPQELDADDTTMVYLGFRNIQKGEGAAGLIENNEQARDLRARYLAPAEPELVPDLYGQGPDAEVRILKNVVTIIYESELADYGEYAVMPVARVRRDSKGIFICDESYFPPCLNLMACSALTELVQGIRDRLVIKTRNLEVNKMISGAGVDALGMLMMLQSLSVSTIRLDNIISYPPTATPWAVYGVLREIMAALSVFSLDMDFNGFQRLNPDPQEPSLYSHHDCAPQFFRLRESIYDVLDSLSTGPRYLVHFEWREPYFVAELSGHMLDEGWEFWLILKGEEGSDAEIVASKASRYLRLASRSGLPVVLAQAVRGIPLTWVKLPPRQLPKGPNLIYFKIHHENRLWDDVANSGLLCAYCDYFLPETEMQLAVLTNGEA